MSQLYFLVEKEGEEDTYHIMGVRTEIDIYPDYIRVHFENLNRYAAEFIIRGTFLLYNHIKQCLSNGVPSKNMLLAINDVKLESAFCPTTEHICFSKIDGKCVEVVHIYIQNEQGDKVEYGPYIL